MNKYLLFLGSFLMYKRLNQKHVDDIPALEYFPDESLVYYKDLVNNDNSSKEPASENAKYTVKELRKLASINKIKGYNKMKKSELLHELNLQL